MTPPSHITWHSHLRNTTRQTLRVEHSLLELWPQPRRRLLPCLPSASTVCRRPCYRSVGMCAAVCTTKHVLRDLRARREIRVGEVGCVSRQIVQGNFRDRPGVRDGASGEMMRCSRWGRGDSGGREAGRVYDGAGVDGRGLEGRKKWTRHGARTSWKASGR